MELPAGRWPAAPVCNGRRYRHWAWLVFAALSCLSCGMSGMVRGKAAKELRCPKEQVHIVGLAVGTRRAIGCQRWADYRCVNSGKGQTYCYRLDEPVGPPPTPEEWRHAHTPGVADH